ncbi:MAG TPA: HAMP domain-containing sensor histidine kinase [Thermoleophilaceae bacterium]|nr:HAMP domain-containing sensor histidine kinase [Thermoleophilaceae bacterium]
MSVTLAAALAGWAVAAVLAIAWSRSRRRLELVARAAHELRGPATVIGLGVAALRREPGGLRRALALESQLDRLAAGLSDLDAARSGRRAAARPAALPLERVLRGTAAGWVPAARSAGRRLRFRWDGAPAVVSADRGRLAQAVGNLVANAVEHGSGPVELRGRRAGQHALVEVRDAGPAGAPAESRGSDRGRGLQIAAEAVEEAGGRLTLERTPDGTLAAVELPLAEP